MSVKEIKGLIRRWFEECNKGEAAFMAVFDELHTTDIDRSILYSLKVDI
jgi:hypothetical protein